MSFSNSKIHEVEKLDSVSGIIPALIDRIKWYGREYFIDSVNYISYNITYIYII